MTNTHTAKRMWDAYAFRAGGITFDGKPLPTWDELGEDRQSCWVAAASVTADRSDKLEAALREIAQTVTIVDENWHPSYHDFSFTQKQAEEAHEELGRRILIARKALEGKDD